MPTNPGGMFSPAAAAQQTTEPAFRRMILDAVTAETGRIVEEECAKAKQAVEDRIIKMKSELAQRVLNRMVFKTNHNPAHDRVQLIVEF